MICQNMPWLIFLLLWKSDEDWFWDSKPSQFRVPSGEPLKRKCHKMDIFFRYDFTESQEASCKHFQGQNRHFRVFESGYSKDFQIY